MKRPFLFAAVLFVAFGVACSSSPSSTSADLGPSGTLRLTLGSGTQLSGISFYTLKLVIGGQTSSLQITAPEPTLPPTQTLDVDLHNDAGTIAVTIEADDATGKPLANGTGTATVEQGKTVDLTISLQPV